MDLLDTPEQAAFRGECRTWIAANAPAHLLSQLEASAFGKLAFEPEEYLREAKAWQKIKATAGWACIGWPKAYGGRGASPIERVIWGQEEGLYGRLGSVFIIGQGMAAPTLMTYGNEEQKRRFLPPMAAGEEIWCQLFSEPGAGSDLAGLRMRAERDGDDWILNGQKVWTSGAHYSDFGILVTRSDFSLPKHKGLTYFYVDMRTPGIDIRPIRQAAGEAGFNEVFFHNVRISDSQRLGEVGSGWAVALTTLMNERFAIGGSMSTGIEDLIKLASQVTIDGGRAIDDPAVRDHLADWFVASNGLLYTNYRTLTALAQGQQPGPENSISKIVAGNTMQAIASFALELQEQSGLLIEHEGSSLHEKFPRMLMRSLGTRIEGGSDEILRNIIAERVLQLPGDIRLDRDVPFNQIPSGA